MLQVRVRGESKYITNDEVRHALKWYLGKLVGPRMASKLSISFVFAKMGDEGFVNSQDLGHMIQIDDSFKPRKFRIRILSKARRRTILRAIAHECTHIKQYVKGELAEYEYSAHFIRWKKKVWDEEPAYWDQPWEQDAYKRQETLLDQYICAHGEG